MSPRRVLIIGCGIAGPVIAILLKRKGYEPIVLEKVRVLGDVGGASMLMPNGLKVLALLGLDDVFTESTPHIGELRDETATEDVLGVSYLPATWKEKYGQPACGVKRTKLNLELKEALRKENIPLHEAWVLKDIDESEDQVVARSEDGRMEQGSFLIGCDGIKSVSRFLVLAQHGVKEVKAEYTGLTQAGGFSPTPRSLKARPTMLKIYGPGVHFICYPSTPTMSSWAITQRESTEAIETWKSFLLSDNPAFRTKLLEQFKDWSSVVQQLIRGTDRLITYGLYDRPQLEPSQWYSPKGRCVLIGDAAHPTSPHLGQGANQALEDCYHLSQLLPDISTDISISSAELLKVFDTFANLRQSRTAALVKGARMQGEDRVVDGGPKACQERDERLRAKWFDEVAVESKYDSLLSEPFVR